MPRYFRKSVLGTPFKISGTPIKWEPVAKDTGVRAFDDAHDAALISALDAAADRRTGGITRISAEIYESLKKNRPLTTSPNPLGVLGEVRINNRDQSLVSPKVRSGPVAAVVVAAPSSGKQHPFATPPSPVSIAASESTRVPEPPPVVAFKPTRAPKSKVQGVKPEQA